MRFVAIKEEWQQDIEAIHRRRERLVRNRVALTNSIRGLLHERGIVIPAGNAKFPPRLALALDENKSLVSEKFLNEMHENQEELRETESRLAEINVKLESYAESNNRCRNIMEVNGIGPLTATALVAAVGAPKNFKSDRQFAAWIGLVPMHTGTGGKNTNSGISKRGAPYLRKLLIHEGRTVIRRTPVDCPPGHKYYWVSKLRGRIGTNKAAVAVANKNARIIWALLAKDATLDKRKWTSKGTA